MILFRSGVELTSLTATVRGGDGRLVTGLSREAVVKALRALRRLGWIDNRGRTIVIRNPERVRQRAVH